MMVAALGARPRSRRPPPDSLKIPTDVRNNAHIDPQGGQKDDLAIAQPADGRTLFCSLGGGTFVAVFKHPDQGHERRAASGPARSHRAEPAEPQLALVP